MRKLSLSLTVVLSACFPGEALPVLPDDAAAVVLRISNQGGFVPPEMLVGVVPTYTLYASGVLVFQGPIPAISPGPLLPNLQQVRLSPSQLDAVLRRVVDAGLLEIEDEHNDQAAALVVDAGTTVFEFRDVEGDHRFSVYAFGLVEFQDRRVKALLDLTTYLDDAVFSGDSRSFQPAAVQVVVSNFPPAESEFSKTLSWPLSDDPAGFPRGSFDLRCRTYEGDDAATLLDVFGSATQETMFESAGTVYRVVARPLVGGVEGCSA